MPRRLQTDRWLFLTTLALCLVGAVMVFSASAVTAREQFGSAYTFVFRQLLWLALGLGGMFWLMSVDYKRLRQPAVIFSALFAALVLLLAVFLVGKSHSTHRWFRLGPVSLQPSEFAKLAVIFYLAWFLEHRRKTGRLSLREQSSSWWSEGRHIWLPALAPVVLFAVLIKFEPDLGTSIELFVITTAVLFVAGLPVSYVLGAGAVALPAIYLLILRVPYQYNRLMAFLNPEADPQGRGFQLVQSLIAVGSGGLFGVGLMESKQKLFYLPEAHTDFIFAVICEELGFIGAAAVLALFAIYGWRGIRAALRAPDEFGRLTALGITVLIVSQALINLGVVLGMVPTKGIPLPFISYGGSSLLVMLLATGVLLNISQQAE